MSRFWVVTPLYYDSANPGPWERAWKFDLDHGIISIGWGELGDISGLTKEELLDRVVGTYSDYSPAAATGACGMLHNFYHAVQRGDTILARRGRKTLAAVGTVRKPAYYDPKKNPDACNDRGIVYPNHLDVEWWPTPRDKSFPAQVFAMQTIYEIPAEKFGTLTEGALAADAAPVILDEGVQDQAEFLLEKYLEDFIVSNFDAIFRKKLALYRDPDAGIVGQQYETEVGVIDILATDVNTGSFVVIELKKGRESDKVVGQVLRYMGWVAEKLCKPGQEVHGIIICKEADERLTYAVKMAKNLTVKCYKIDFQLQDQP